MREDTRSHSPHGDLPLAEEVYRVMGAAIEVHKVLGPGFLEAVYQEALEIELGARGIPFLPQAPLQIRYKDRVLERHYIADFLVFSQILVEIKAIPAIGKTEQAQVLNYIKATGVPIALLVNFGARGKLEWQRLVNGIEPSRVFDVD